ncbi:UNVERIFIED_CONTAM: hypothetical protein Slati_1167200 [Sesamum latifolium]|uniref:Uncharacterized protein n=1 Tax=Sesamum latifolium TaxID=2727402 RepID=A0AAW2XG88_9LAMI
MSTTISSMWSSTVGFVGDGGGGGGDVYVRLEKWASKPRPNIRSLFLPPTAANHIYCSVISTDASDSVGVWPLSAVG